MTTAERREASTTLTIAGKRIEAALEVWKNDLNRINDQHTYDPSRSRIKPSTSVSDALHVLASSLAYHNSRARNLERPSHGLIDLILAHCTGIPLKSTVTRDWHVKCCLAAVEEELLSLHEDLSIAEDLRTYQLEQALHLQAGVLEMEQSENLAVIIKAVDLSEYAQRLLQDSTYIERSMESADFEQWKFDTQQAVDRVGRCRASLGVHDRAINMLLGMISSIVGQVPRQRLITESFEPAA